jgi:energy-coupling factor transporter ATP-binding protein EcfA2
MGVQLVGDKAGVWHDRATGEKGRLLKLWQEVRGITFQETIQKASEYLNIAPPEPPAPRSLSLTNYIAEEPPDFPPSDDAPPPPPPLRSGVDWKSCLLAFDDAAAQGLVEWRGFSREFVDWLHAQEMIGMFKGKYALPVHSKDGKVTRIHYRLEKGWAYHPGGHTDSGPLVIGNPIHASHTLAFESQWDAFSVLDRLGAHLPENAGIYAAYITRGATSNTDISSMAVPHLIACPQNDPREKASKVTGRTPAEEWLEKIQKSRHKISEFTVFATPAKYKDANDWIREESPDQHAVFSAVIEKAKNPILDGVYNARTLMDVDTDNDPNALIGWERRFLAKGSAMFLIGPSGIGKSTLTMGMAIHAAAGVEWHGLTFRKPMRTLVVQAENDKGDLAEMLKGVLGNHHIRHALGDDGVRTVGKNLMFRDCSDLTGERFVRWLEELIRETKADLVVVDPILSYVGDDISLQKVSSSFFRNGMGPMLSRTGAIAILVHHTGKPSRETKTPANWSDSDYSYNGLGSSDMINWARAAMVLMSTSEKGIYRLLTTKRGARVGLRMQHNGQRSADIYIRHGIDSEGQLWFQVPPPVADEKPERGNGRKSSPIPANDDTLLAAIPGCATYQDVVKCVMEAGGMSAHAAKQRVGSMIVQRVIVKGADDFYRKKP